MRKVAGWTIASAGLALASCSARSASPDVEMASASPGTHQGDGIESTRFAGPGLVCGLAFAIQLRSGEELVKFDRGMDFITYRLAEAEKSAVIYEGNAPQEADIRISTGKSFPSVIAVHLKATGFRKDLGRRLLVRERIPEQCASTTEE